MRQGGLTAARGGASDARGEGDVMAGGVRLRVGVERVRRGGGSAGGRREILDALFHALDALRGGGWGWGKVGERSGVSVGTWRGGRADSCREGRGRSSGGSSRASDASSARDAPPRRSRRCSWRPAWRSSWRRGSRRTRRSPCSTGRRDAGWLPRPVPCGDSGAPSARRGGRAARSSGARPVRACARGLCRSSGDERRRYAVERACEVRDGAPRPRRRPSRGDQTAAKRIFRVGIRSVRDSKIESTVGDSSIRARAWRAARGGYNTVFGKIFTEVDANEKCATTRAPCWPIVAPRPSLPSSTPRDGRGEASVSRTPRRPRDVLAGGRPPRGFGDRVGRVRCGGLDRPGERHLSSPSIPSRPSPRRVRPSRGLDRVALPLERRARRRARRSARGRVRRSLRAHLHRPKRQGRGHPRARDLRRARSRPAQALLRPHRQHARRRAHGPRVHPPIRAARVPRRVPRATGPHARRRSRRALPTPTTRRSGSGRLRSTTTATSNTPTPPPRSPATRACSSSPPSIPTGSPRSDAPTPTVAI